VLVKKCVRSEQNTRVKQQTVKVQKCEKSQTTTPAFYTIKQTPPKLFVCVIKNVWIKIITKDLQYMYSCILPPY